MRIRNPRCDHIGVANGLDLLHPVPGHDSVEGVEAGVELGHEILRRVEEHGVTLICGAPAVLNAVLDYGLIFGHFGLPAWGVAGAGIAVGPILGGWTTTELSWRVVFVGEVVVALAILLATRLIREFQEGAK